MKVGNFKSMKWFLTVAGVAVLAAIVVSVIAVPSTYRRKLGSQDA